MSHFDRIARSWRRETIRMVMAERWREQGLIEKRSKAHESNESVRGRTKPHQPVAREHD